MTEYSLRVPDIGEGIAEAEVSLWHVAVGDRVEEDQIVAELTTDKATVELPSHVAGRVVSLACEAGDMIAVGATLMHILRDDEPPEERAASTEPVLPSAALEAVSASPAVRSAARDRGIDLQTLKGSGPDGRILLQDLDPGGPGTKEAVTEQRVTGLRRQIAERMTRARAEAPHFTLVEEVDVSETEHLRTVLNGGPGRLTHLTILPFVMRAVILAVADHPEFNAHYDTSGQVIRRFAAVHVGIATQTARGLLVPVLRDADRQDLPALASDLRRLAESARAGTIDASELTGSTITVSSLGPFGGIATTPILNLPEVAIVGVNRVAMRPAWIGHSFTSRSMMNLSCSFDHRAIDGWQAGLFVQRLKELLETPSLLFLAHPRAVPKTGPYVDRPREEEPRHGI